MSEEDNKKFVAPRPPDSLVLANVLNEVLRGFHITNFEAQIGASTRFVQELERNLNSTTANFKPDSFSQAELLVLRNATTVAESELGDEDFSTRVGVSPAIVYRILDEWRARSEPPKDE